MADFDRISIKISADASSATRSVNNLVQALAKLNKELGALDTANLSSFSAAVKVLANSVEALNKGTASIRETSRAFKDLGKSTSSIKKATEATQDLAHTSTSLSNITDSVDNFTRSAAVLLEIFQRILSGFSGINNGSRTVSSDMDGVSASFEESVGEAGQAVVAYDAVVAALGRMFDAFENKTPFGGFLENQTVFDTTYREITETTEEMGKMARSAEDAAEGMERMDSSGLESAASSSQKLYSEFLKTSNAVDSIKSKFKGIFVPTKQFESLEEKINKVVNKYNELLRKMQEAVNAGNMSVGDKQYTQMAAELDALRNKYDSLILKQRQLAQEGNAVRLNPNVEKSLGAFKSGFTAVTNLVKNGFVAGIRSANSHLKSFGNRIKSTLTSVNKTITSGHKATDMAKKFARELLRVSKMLKLMVTRMALRAVIKEVGNGFKSLALHSKEFNESVSSMMNGAKKLGYSFASMVSPLINALAPAINYVIGLLTKLLNALNQLFSVFTGKTTYNKSKDFTEDWAANIEDANKNAKELKKTVLGFDELNQLQERYSSGGDTSGNITDMFETVDIDPKWFEIMDWLKDMWKMGDFTELGTKLGEGLRDLLENIPWDDIKDVAAKLGSSLATLINGFVEVERLGYDIGKTMGESINTVFEFLNDFVHNLHWDSIGRFIGETFNGFFENIDWDLIKDTVVTGMAGVAEAIQNFIDTFHWDNVSNFIINAVNTIVSGVKAFIENIDWLDLGIKLGDQLNKTIKGVDWYNLGSTLGGVIQSIIDVAYGFVTTFDTKEAVKALEDFLSSVSEKIDFKKAGETIGTALQKIINIIKEFFSNPDNIKKLKDDVQDFFEGLFKALDKKDLSIIIGGILVSAITMGIAGIATSALKIAFAEKVKAIIAGGTAGKAATAAETGKIATEAAEVGAVVEGIGNSALFSAGATASFFAQINQFKKSQDLDVLNELLKNGSISLDQYKAACNTTTDEVHELVGKFKDGTVSTEEFRTELDKIISDSKNFKVYWISEDIDQWIKDNALWHDSMELTDEDMKRLGDTGEQLSQSTGGLVEEWKKNYDSLSWWQKGLVNLSGDYKASAESINTSTETIASDMAYAQAEISGTWTEMSRDASNGTSEITKTLNDFDQDQKETFKSIQDSMSEENWTFKGVWEGLTKTFEKAKDGIKGIWNNIADKLNGEHEVGDGKFRIKLPKFYATGGFPEDGWFRASHGEIMGRFDNGQSVVANNAQIVDGISAGVYNAVTAAMASGNNGGSEYIANTIVVDGDVIARVITQAQNKQNMRYSPQMG